MKIFANYHNFSEFKHIPSGIKKLDFLVNTIRNYYSPSNRVNILEIGCGNGNISIPLASLGFSVTGIDMDIDSIKYANDRNKFYNAVFVNNKVEEFNSREHFDVIICSEVFEHVKDPIWLSKQMQKFGTPDSLFIITIPNGYSLSESIGLIEKFLGRKTYLHAKKIKELLFKKQQYFDTMSNIGEGSKHLHHFSLNKFSHILHKAGIEIISIHDSNFIFGTLYRLFLTRIIRSDSRIFHFLDDIDCLIADLLPHCLASGWYFVCSKCNS